MERRSRLAIMGMIFCSVLAFLLTEGCTDTTPSGILDEEGIAPVGPYLQNLDSHGVSVLWGSLDETSSEVVVHDSSGTEIGRFRDGGLFHSVRISGLTPGTEYTYQVIEEGDNRIGGFGHFKTAPLPQSPQQNYSFAMWGDSGQASKEQFEIAHQVRLFNPDFVLLLGDIVYPDGAEDLYNENYFAPYQDLIKNKVFWPSLGNHDLQKENGKAYFKFFETPANNPAKSERFYSFAYGNALFIALDSTNLQGHAEQMAFLEQQLSVSTHLWHFVFFHHPPYSSGAHGSSLKLREQIGPIVEKYDVDMVFTGHDHHYERTNSRQDYEQDDQGTIYIVSGGGGANLTTGKFSEFTEVSSTVHHFVGVTITGNQLHLQAIDRFGTPFDGLILEKNVN